MVAHLYTCWRSSLLLVCVGSLISLVGCNSIFGASPKTKGAGGVPLEATAGIDPDVTPFILEVVDEVNDGERLLIKGRLLPKSSWPAHEVVVRLSALDKGGQQRTSFHAMNDLLAGEGGKNGAPRTLEKGVAQTFSLMLPRKGISSYQLEVLWGKEALPYVAKEKPGSPKNEPKQFIALRNMEVHRVPSESCSTPDECLVSFAITGELFNSGSAIVKDVVIVAGFGTPGKLDLRGEILENEKRVEVPNLRLAPGAGQRFKITIEKLVPSSAQVAPNPIVRIASFRSE